MPLYDFECPSCQNQFETMKSISARNESEPCPNCGEPAQLQIAAVAVLKGAVPCGGNTGYCPGSAPLSSGGVPACGATRGGCSFD